MNSQDVTGTVVDISSANTTCKSNKNCAAWGSHECTKFNAIIELSPDSNQKYKISIDAGHADDFNRSIEAANFSKGASVGIKYNPKLRQVYSAKQLYDYIHIYLINIFGAIFFCIAGYWKYLKRKPPIDLINNAHTNR